MDDVTKTLIQAGLRKDEAHIYLATLALGAASLSVIARKAGVKRPTAYNVIEVLVQRGLISRSPKEKRTVYVAESPQKILVSLRVKAAELETALPHLESLRGAAPTRPRVRFFEGREGLQVLYRELFATHRTLLGLASIEKINRVFPPAELAEFSEILRAHGGRIRDLMEDSAEAHAYASAAYRKSLGPVKFLPKGVAMATDMLVENSKVAFISYSSLVGVIIEDEAIAATQQQLFESMWKNS